MVNDRSGGTTNVAQSPLKSVHTSNFPALLRELGVSLLVSTYQAGKLIVVRADGDELNTHFRVFDKPMGLAYGGNRLALGTARAIEQYRNVPDVARKLEPPERHDGCFLPCHTQVTGNIDVHEMAWAADGELWIVNTRFSSLCTLDPTHSFVPRWRPGFVKALAPDDRCHLNGLGLRDGRPRYVTALGASNEAQGWREDKASGGVLVDVDTQEVVGHGLSMPHSPRWYADRLWVLESGWGSLATLEPGSGELETVAKLPGFTRGLDFWGPVAFIGLSQVRETAVFSGIPITELVQERTCGVWAVNLRSGETIAFLRFEGAVQEIFGVQVLPGLRFPEILERDDPLIATSYVLPDEALADVPQLS